MSRLEGNPKPEYSNIPKEKKTAAYSKKYYEKNKEQRRADGREYQKKFRLENPGIEKQRKHKYWQSKPQEERSQICFERRLKQRFNRTPQWYDETLEQQSGHCGLCNEVPSVRRFHVDHDHKCCPGRYTCGRCIRGLLCNKCNTVMGHFERILGMGTYTPHLDTWTYEALQYLEKYKAFKEKEDSENESSSFVSYRRTA